MQSLIFHIFWVLTFSTSIYALDNLDQLFDDNREPIAHLQKQVGLTRVRPIDLSLWRDLDEGQKFYEGDVISTGLGSYAKIKFKNGRVLELDENSLISLKIEENSKSSSVLITLIQGNVSTKATKVSKNNSSRPKLKFKSGQTKIALLSSASGLQLSKSSRTKNAGVKVTSGQVKVQKAGSSTKNLKKNEIDGNYVAPKMLASLGTNFLSGNGSFQGFTPASTTAPEVAPEFALKAIKPIIVVPKEVIIIPKSSDMPRIVWPRSGGYIWTQKSLKKNRFKGLQIAMTMPRRNAEMRWKPIVQLGSRSSELIFRAKSRNGKQVKLISGQDIIENAKRTKRGRIENYSINLRSGILIDDLSTGNGDEESFSKSSSKINLRSFADLPSGGYVVRVSSIRLKPLRAGQWVEQSSSGVSAGIGTEIVVDTKEKFLKLLPLLNGNQNFSITPGKIRFSGQGTYLVRNRKIVAKISSVNTDITSAKAIGRIFNSDLIYSGNASALIAGVSNFAQLKQGNGKISRGENYFLLDGTKLVPVKRTLIQKDPKALASLFENVDTFFAAPVRLLSIGK